MDKKKICIVAILCACASMRISAQDFYTDYGIVDPVAFATMLRQSNAQLEQLNQEMQRQAEAWNAAQPTNADRLVDAAARYNAIRMAREMEMQLYRMQSDSIDAEMSAEASRQKCKAIMRETTARRIADIQGVTYDQYRTAKSTGLIRVTGNAEHPQGDETLYSDWHDNLYRVDKDGRAYQQHCYGESRVR